MTIDFAMELQNYRYYVDQVESLQNRIQATEKYSSVSIKDGRTRIGRAYRRYVAELKVAKQHLAEAERDLLDATIAMAEQISNEEVRRAIDDYVPEIPRR